MRPDRLLINGLTADCRLGVTDQEQATPQRVWIDLELAIDARRAAARDAVDDALDYARLVQVVSERVQRKPYRLLETMAEDVAAQILGQFATPEVLVRVHKRALPGIESAAVEIVRSNRQGSDPARSLGSDPGSRLGSDPGR
jgi:dihydroneopterin aldolase